MKTLKNLTIVLILAVFMFGCGGGGGGTTTQTTDTTTQTTDTIPPTVSSTSPTNGETIVLVEVTISAAFSEAMDSSTITTSTFTVGTGSSTITGTVTYYSSTKTATFNPSTNLSPNTTYTAMITTGVKDSAGNAMAANYTWSFTTGSATTTSNLRTPSNGAYLIDFETGEVSSSGNNKDLWLDDNTNFNTPTISTKGLVVDVGSVSGLSKITEVPIPGWTQTTAAIKGHGYVVQTIDRTVSPNQYTGRFYRIYVSDYIISATTGGVMGFEIKWTLLPSPSTAPSAPTGVTVATGDGQVTISWNSVTGATSYNIYWSTTSGVSKTSYSGWITSITTASYTHTGLTNGTTYYYVVTAVSSNGESSESSQASATPQTFPTGVSATAGDGQVTISWNSVTGATSYNIYWLTTSGVTKTTGTKISNVTSPYTHTGLTNGITYYYVVTDVLSYGESSASSEVSARLYTTAPSAPTGVTFVRGGIGQRIIGISWNSVTDATSYNIYYSTTSGVTKTTGTKISNVTSPYTLSVILQNATYYYVVTAVNSYGESSESSEV